MAKVKDFYNILDVERDATEKEIKLAFRKLAKTHHPDVSDMENAEEIFKEIQTAYEVLSVPETRAEYDEDLARSEEGTNYTIKDIYAMFNKDGRNVHAPIKGEDVEMEVEFTISEVVQHATKTIGFERYTNCTDCKGHGYNRELQNMCPGCKGTGNMMKTAKTPFGEIKQGTTCKQCNGNGYVHIDACETCEGKGKTLRPVEVSFQLPKETREGYIITLKGKGDAGLNGGMNGDLILTMRHDRNKDSFCFANDVDIETNVTVPFKTCLKGGKFPVKLPSGKTLDIPIQRGTQHGHQVMVPEQGMVNPYNGFKGLLTIIVHVEVPTELPDDKISKILNILG